MGNLKERKFLENLGVGNIQVNLKKMGEDYVLDSGRGPLAVLCERDNEPLDFVSSIIYFEADQ